LRLEKQGSLASRALNALDGLTFRVVLAEGFAHRVEPLVDI
jgi:hypothetical protein